MGKSRGLALVLVLFELFVVSVARAEKVSGPPITFSKLVLRLDTEPEIALIEGEYRVHILEYLRGAGYNSVGAENLVFDTDNSDKAEFALGGTIREVTCVKLRRKKDACRIGIEWQVLHIPTEIVVYKVLARAAIYDVVSFDDKDIGRRLILGAVRRLLLRKAFKKLLDTPPELLDVPMPPARFARCPSTPLTLPEQAEQAMKATGLIEVGNGFGSGVFLNHQGYMLTAAHVVQGGASRSYSRAANLPGERAARLREVRRGVDPCACPSRYLSVPCARADVTFSGCRRVRARLTRR